MEPGCVARLRSEPFEEEEAQRPKETRRGSPGERWRRVFCPLPAGEASRAPIITQNIADGLARLAPEHRATFEQNRQAFLGRLDQALAAWMKTMEPFKGEKVVVYHPLWIYFLTRFGLTQSAALEDRPGISPRAKPFRDGAGTRCPEEEGRAGRGLFPPAAEEIDATSTVSVRRGNEPLAPGDMAGYRSAGTCKRLSRNARP